MMSETERLAQVAAAAPTPSQVVLQLMSGAVVAQALYVAARLGIADHLAHGSLPAAELAVRIGANPPSLARLLRALASLGVVSERDGAVALAPLGRPLAQDAPDSVRAPVLFAGAEQYRAWGELLYSVQTGDAAFPRVYGTGCYDYFATHPEAGRSFDASMVETGGALGSAVAAAYDFAPVRTVVDVGGGQGAVLAAILQANPGLQGVLFDLPQIVPGAGAVLAAEGVAERCAVVGGSFFEALPVAGDPYLLARTLLNWPDEDVRRVGCAGAIAGDRAAAARWCSRRRRRLQRPQPAGPRRRPHGHGGGAARAAGGGRAHADPRRANCLPRQHHRGDAGPGNRTRGERGRGPL
jgi:hypothetical protein